MKGKVGVFFNLFDPVSAGHLEASFSAAADSGASTVLMVMLPGPASESDDHRWRMLVAACAGRKNFVPIRAESGDPDAQIGCLRQEYPDDELVCIENGGCSSLISGEDILQAKVSLGSEYASSPSVCIPLPVYEYIMASGLYAVPSRIPESSAWLEMLFKALKPHRFAHSLSVAATARLLAERFGEDPEKAETAGLLHDCAKNLPLAEMHRIVEASGVDVDERMLMRDSLLHSIAGACMVQQDYGVTDPDIIDAVASHNTGRPGMSRLSMCVCLADSIEPGRIPYPHIDEIRKLAESSLEKALLLSLEGVKNQVLSNGWYLHPRTRDTVEWLRSMNG